MTKISAPEAGKEPLVSYEVCQACGCDKPKLFVHGHYQCADCKCVTDGDCCQGETNQ